MKIQGHIIWMLLLLGCGYGTRKDISTVMMDPANNLVQEKKVADFNIRLTYLPMHWKKLTSTESAAAAGEMTFRLRVTDRIPGRKPAPVAEMQDSMFALIRGKDTLKPLMAERIADGGFNGAEFMVIFPRQAITGDSLLQFLFSDQLFTHHILRFPLNIHQINTIDSISSRL